ncbi:hypothetical protein ACJX0J_026715 [Zea mays]
MSIFGLLFFDVFLDFRRMSKISNQIRTCTNSNYTLVMTIPHLEYLKTTIIFAILHQLAKQHSIYNTANITAKAFVNGMLHFLVFLFRTEEYVIVALVLLHVGGTLWIPKLEDAGNLDRSTTIGWPNYASLPNLHDIICASFITTPGEYLLCLFESEGINYYFFQFLKDRNLLVLYLIALLGRVISVAPLSTCCLRYD